MQWSCSVSVVTVALPSLELCGGCADTVLAMQRQRKEDGCEGVVLVVQSSLVRSS